MDKHRTAAYGDYRYFDANYEYPIDQDFYRYGITEAPDYNTDPSTLTNFRYTKRDLQQYWNHYKKYYRITFPPAIDTHHYKTFKRNLRNLTLLAKNNPTVNFRINQFMHLTYEEFIGNYTGFNGTFDGSNDAVVESYEVELDKYARQLDWSVHDNAVTLTPKNQNSCKNSFLYSAIHNLELKLIIDDSTTTGKDIQYMSLQQGYDCSNPRRTCDSGGGQPHFVFRGLQQSGGIQFDSYMEKELLNNLTCQWHDDNGNATKKIAAIQRWGLISVQDEDELKLALNEYGPLSTEGIPYWILKNSWGGRWGERGYMFLLRNRAACSIGRYLAYALVPANFVSPREDYEPTEAAHHAKQLFKTVIIPHRQIDCFFFLAPSNFG
ncbi:papain family cysteine protease domain-containing protein [Phthorimaea operculella]|nr:papain family cysteine protease domain-containing protein [Phthorimaea operculella]